MWKVLRLLLQVVVKMSSHSALLVNIHKRIWKMRSNIYYPHKLQQAAAVLYSVLAIQIKEVTIIGAFIDPHNAYAWEWVDSLQPLQVSRSKHVMHRKITQCINRWHVCTWKLHMCGVLFVPSVISSSENVSRLPQISSQKVRSSPITKCEACSSINTPPSSSGWRAGNATANCPPAR